MSARRWASEGSRGDLSFIQATTLIARKSNRDGHQKAVDRNGAAQVRFEGDFGVFEGGVARLPAGKIVV